MLWLRRVIFTFPVVVLAFFLAAFLLVKIGPKPRENALVLGSIGEPENVNPIRATTTSASEVTSLIFNGLLGVNEKLELIPELATDWQVDQSSWMYFDKGGDASAVADALRAATQPDFPTTRPDGLTEIRVDGKTLLLQFHNSAGHGYHDAIKDVLLAHPPRPVWLITVNPGKLTADPKTDASGKKLGQLDVAEQAIRAAAAASGNIEILQAYRPLDQVIELVGHGPVEEITAVLDELVKSKVLAGYESPEQYLSQDKPRLTFNLRKGVKWHAGEYDNVDYRPTEFTAEDVKFTWESLVSPDILSKRAPDYMLVESCTVLDRYKVQITYKKPYGVALNSWTMGVLPRHVLAGKNAQWWSKHYDSKPIGTGPFKYAEWRKNERFRLVRNDDYWAGRPNIETIYIRYIPDQVNINLALDSGGIDFYSVEPHAVKRYEEDKRFELFRFLSRSYAYIGWNLKRPMFQDRRVRIALAHAVNIDEIIKYKLYGHARQSKGIYWPEDWWANPNIKPFDYDPGKAKKLLAEAGWTDTDGDGWLDKDGKRFSFELITNNANEIRRDIGVIVQANLKAIGIDVQLRLIEWAVFIENHINKQNFDACILGWSMGMDYDMYQLFHSSQSAADGGLNHCSYVNRKADELIERIRVTFDREQVRRMCWELQQLIYDDQPYLFIYVPEATVAMQKDTYRVYRPLDDGSWKEEPIRQVPAGFTLYLPYWYRLDHPPAGVAKAPAPAPAQEVPAK